MPDTTKPPLVAVAHGTRAPEGPPVIGEILDAVRAQLPGTRVVGAYVDVLEPHLAGVLADVAEASVVVPMFLASGYHVRVDVPRAVRDEGAEGTRVSDALGPDGSVVAAVAQRFAEAEGAEPVDAVVLAAAGSSDARARGDVERAAALLAERLGRPVVPAYVTSAEPRIPDAVAGLRAGGAARVGIASYLLAPGLFSRSLTESGADVVAEPIGPHPDVVGLIADRYRGALES